MFEEVDTLLFSENKGKYSIDVQCIFCLSDTGTSPVVFGSNVERLMFPMHSAPTRLGIEQGIRGEPHCGPGSYDQDPVREIDISTNSSFFFSWYCFCSLKTRNLKVLKDGTLVAVQAMLDNLLIRSTRQQNI